MFMFWIVKTQGTGFFSTNSKTTFSICLNRQEHKDPYTPATIILGLGNKMTSRSKTDKKKCGL